MTQNNLPPDAPSPRLCVVEKRDGEKEYGYNLHAEKGRGQFVGLVDNDSPAQRGGLIQGDRIFAVNGHSIIGETHKKVVERIKQNPERCEMLVINEEGAKWYADHGIEVSLDLPNIHRINHEKSRPNTSPPPNGSWYAPTFLQEEIEEKVMETEQNSYTISYFLLKIYTYFAHLFSWLFRRLPPITNDDENSVKNEEIVRQSSSSSNCLTTPHSLPSTVFVEQGKKEEEETKIEDNTKVLRVETLPEEDEEEEEEESIFRTSFLLKTLVSSSPEIDSSRIPKLSWKSESVRVKRKRVTMDIREQERNAIREFDTMLMDYSDVRESSVGKSADEPVFVPPPPPHPPSFERDEMTPQPRLAHLAKSSPLDEFGFNLHAEKNRGHFIGTVDAGGIGENAGLRMGQRIVGVNGLLIYPNTPHKDVVALIKKSPLSTTLLVASEDVDKWYRDNGFEYSFDNVEKFNDHPAPEVVTSHHEEVHHEEIHHHNHNHEDLNPHSIQVNEEREIIRTTTVITNGTNNYDYKDDLLDQVFAGVQIAETTNTVQVLSHTQELSETGSTTGSFASSHRESAVDVPIDHKYVPSYVSPQHHHHQNHQSNQQPSPLSNGSSHGYAGSSTGGYEDDDIYHLSAKEARERLRNKNRKHHLHEMSLNEKYQLVSNM
ncbi:unnamed protein product [Caenorhabditis angaria]|uniref:PDZ domain-containing protein n=1 Tax=Caenorhabditis angaria TaxID=860376 RepID=A0A9P1IPU0_9PELO|nr:unnamed protein product [Caenorhabditis angaria]